jgi:hypothetical protein
MKTDVFEIVSHSERSAESVLTGSDNVAADHVVSCTAFTAEGRDNGRATIRHRFGLVLLCDPSTSHGKELSDDMTVHVITGLLDRFKELLNSTFGEDVVSLAMMQGLAEMLGVDDDDGPFTDEDAEEAGESKELLNAAYRAHRGGDNVH